MTNSVECDPSAVEVPAAGGSVWNRRRIMWVVAETLMIAVALWITLFRIAGMGQIAEAINSVAWWVVPLAIVLEAASLGSYAELLRETLSGVGVRVSRRLVYRVNLSGTALGKVLPGGTTFALPFSVGMLHSAGADPALSTAALAGSGMLSSVVLALLLPVTVLPALASGNSGALVVGVLVLAVAVWLAALVIGPALRNSLRMAQFVESVARFVARGPLRSRIRPVELGAMVGRSAAALHDLTANRAVLRRAATRAAANWMLDFAAFALIAASVGKGSPLAGLPLAYVVGQMSAAIPLTPGGVGVVETTMVAALVAQGMEATTAVAAVLGWRLLSHWLPLVVGLLAYAMRPRALSKSPGR
jgi:uncharacterized protein (TIRG00374 family)